MPVKHAKFIFEEAFGSLMAHSIRALSNHLLKRGVELDVRIIPDQANAIPGATSFLRTKFKQKSKEDEHDRVIAFIFIHQYANKHLARMCIAHEIYHILLEFQVYIDVKREGWAGVAITPEIEKSCDIFATELCKRHDAFNKSEDERKKHLYFPDGIFSDTKNTRHCDGKDGLGFDSENPFYKKPTFRD
jgi:Zn-dependent peptidase ImmA (M78 family)